MFKKLQQVPSNKHQALDKLIKQLRNFDSVTQQNASASEELASTSRRVTGQVEALRLAMTFFKTDQEANSHKSKAVVSRRRSYL